MIKMKKILLLTAVLTASLLPAAHAAEIQNVDKKIAESYMTVSANGFAAGEKVDIRVLYPNVTSVSDGKQTNTIAYMGNAVADENGNLDLVQIGMPTSTNNEIITFKLELIGSTSEKLSKDVAWIDSEGLNGTMSDITGAATSSAMMQELLDIMEVLDMSFIDLYGNDFTGDRNKLAAQLYEQRADFEVLDDVVNAMNYLILQESIYTSDSEATTKELLANYASLLDEELFDSIYDKMLEDTDMTAEFYSNFHSLRTKLDGTELGFEKVYKEAVLTAYIEHVDVSGDLLPVLNSTYSSVLDADDVAAFQANPDKQIDACDAITDARETDLTKISDLMANPNQNQNQQGSTPPAVLPGRPSQSTPVITVPSNPKPTNPSTPPVVTPADPTGFADVPSTHYASASISYLANKGVIDGYDENGTKFFDPDGNMTREQFVKMVLLAFDYEVKNVSYGFSDVASDAWYADYVNTAAELGIINGVDENRFGAGEKITREQMCTIIYRVAADKGIDLTGNSQTELKDSDKISEYAAEAVSALVKAGIVSGDENSYFNPQGNATRANAAKVLHMVITAN